jgi:hypothetical protein
MTISEATPLGMPLPPVTPLTRLRSPAVRVDAHVPPRESPELLKRDPVAEEILFAPNIDGRLRITEPFVVAVERREGVVTARIEDIGEFGYGSSSGEALYDLGKTLAELYFSLRDSADHLSDDLRAVWLELNEHIQPRQR